MKLGGLSTKEVDQISKILDEYQVEYELTDDESMWKANEHTLKNDLRHLSSPSVSTHVLAIQIKTQESELSPDLKTRLEPFGVSFELPPEMDGSEIEDPVLEMRKKSDEGNRRIVGVTFGLEILVGIFVFLISSYYLLKEYF
ncbi:MAG: hypothetical protein CME62_00220 [Halobacteriovoraceae bacterium]|nr:hypothetical protein [Halobacteriovoraceae bacterium]|tara:strand:+ start:17947 stop:18372 length:426 start_codon:yes stop_codon:yes gene_type:complete